MKESAVRNCPFCQEIVSKQYLSRHFEECHKAPPALPGEKICCVCCLVKRVDEFHRRRRGSTDSTERNNTCAECARSKTHQWFVERRASREARKAEEIKSRPGRYVFKECPYGCGQMFRWLDMIYHKPRCPKKPPREDGKKHGFVIPREVPNGVPMTTEEASEAQRRKIRSSNLSRSYGIDVAEFERMLKEQGGECKICRQPPDPNHIVRHKRVLAVDHDHATGKVRGLLCYNCNHGIGNFLDDPMNLAKAIIYLRRFQEFDLWEVIHFLQYNLESVAKTT